MGGIAKGSGMIHPNMATMLCFLTTDANIAPAVLDSALRIAVKDSFNMVSIDGDTSTNDMTAILANGLAENDPKLKRGRRRSISSRRRCVRLPSAWRVWWQRTAKARQSFWSAR